MRRLAWVLGLALTACDRAAPPATSPRPAVPTVQVDTPPQWQVADVAGAVWAAVPASPTAGVVRLTLTETTVAGLDEALGRRAMELALVRGRELAGEAGRFTVLGHRDLTIASGPALAVDAELRRPGRAVRYRQYAFARGERWYVLTGEAPAATFATWAPAFEAAAGGVQVAAQEHP